jgi:periplasmic protein TonB
MGRTFLLLLVLFGLALAAPAAAVPPKRVTNADWLRKPSPDDITRYYPKLAQDHYIDGKVRVQCRLANDGVLNDCVVLSEAPTGYGFGEAALNVATRFQMRPGTRDGQPIAGQIIVPISFRTEPSGTVTGRDGPGPTPGVAISAGLILLYVASVIG